MPESGVEADFEIRSATRADLRMLLEHRVSMLEDVFPLQSRTGAIESLTTANADWLDRHFGRDFEAWLAVRGNEVAGSAAVIWFDHPPTPVNPGGIEAYILNVYTAPLWRRRGIARALLERIIARARAKEVHRIWLRASPEARPLCTDMGFATSNYLQLREEWPEGAEDSAQ